MSGRTDFRIPAREAERREQDNARLRLEQPQPELATTIYARRAVEQRTGAEAKE